MDGNEGATTSYDGALWLASFFMCVVKKVASSLKLFFIEIKGADDGLNHWVIGWYSIHCSLRNYKNSLNSHNWYQHSRVSYFRIRWTNKILWFGSNLTAVRIMDVLVSCATRSFISFISQQSAFYIESCLPDPVGRHSNTGIDALCSIAKLSCSVSTRSDPFSRCFVINSSRSIVFLCAFRRRVNSIAFWRVYYCWKCQHLRIVSQIL